MRVARLPPITITREAVTRQSCFSLNPTLPLTHDHKEVTMKTQITRQHAPAIDVHTESAAGRETTTGRSKLSVVVLSAVAVLCLALTTIPAIAQAKAPA